MVDTRCSLLGVVLSLCIQVALSTPAQPTPVIPDGPGHEGADMIFLPGQEEMMHGGRKAISFTQYRWTEVLGYPQVPYRFADSNVSQTLVKAAINHWVDNTCLTFPEVASDYSGAHIYFQRHASSCNSYVGMTFSTGQPINVPVWCENSFGSLVHEIGHAIGFYHEQSRNDRNSYVNISSANIKPSAINNFNLASDNNYSVPYDYSSDMHYSGKAFTTNYQITIATVNPLYQGVIGQRTGLSHMDKLLANRMYSCIDKYLATCSLSSDPCQNNGFIGDDCNCVCPDGTSGTNCETLTTNYNEVKLSAYSEILTTEGVVSSPNYPSSTPEDDDYTKWIQAPACKLVKLTFSDFTTYGRSTVNGVSVCRYEGLEIRTIDMYDGTWYCGSDLESGSIITSSSNEMILYFYTNVGGTIAKWSATITFVVDPSCSETTSTSTSTSSTTTTTPPSTTTTTSSTTTSPSTTTTSSSMTTAPSTTTKSLSTTTTTTPSTTTASSSTTTPTSTTTTSSSTTTPPSTSTSSSTTTTTPPSTTMTSSSTTTRPSTSTTSLSTTTTTSTTSTTTTSFIPACNSIDYGSGRKGFYSPGFPNNYPNNAICQFENNQPGPYFALMSIVKFKLNRGDSLLLEHPYGPPTTLKRSRKRFQIMKFPAHFRATFTSDSADTKKGFLIKFVEQQGRCHKSIDGTTTGRVTTPGYPKKHWKKMTCEWKISVTPGKRVRLSIRIKNVKCKYNYVAVDKTPGDTAVYDPSAIETFCGKKKTEIVTSDTHEISVFYYGFKRDAGIKVTYEEIP